LLVSLADNNRTKPVNGHTLNDLFCGRFVHGDSGRFLVPTSAAEPLGAALLGWLKFVAHRYL
jgi:hypothetical protein